jgi:hypothetical protein
MAADIPQAYRRALRDNGIDSVRQNLTDMRNRARTENNPELALSIVPAGQAYSDSILRGLRMSSSHDVSLERYMNENFSREVAALFASTNVNNNANNGATTPDPAVDGRGGVRGAGDLPNPAGGTVTIQPLNNAGQATVEQPVQNSRGNTRGSY